jgi:eukaryotic-like serine/threonine-protein kinase
MQTDPNFDRDREIFLSALERSSAVERAAFLDGACGGDAALRLRLEDLLRNHRADSFLESPGAGALPTQVMAASAIEQPGTRIGRYKLLQEIGEGGMGAVYMAEQEEPVRRRVALKIIKLGMDSRQVVARFEAERQALALMDHPNIARVLDGGATETGRPYFVMELVQGVPITEFCDKNKLPAQERLKIFIQVCQAIQSAHQKGIIHRDIKPSNVLVTLHHGEPMPKVIDFGIAKATNQKLTEKTLFTQHATMIGTPAYMSPEQAEMSSLDVDTRTDVYALGVLLYELLTGTTPFPEKRLRSLGYGEIQRVIMNEEPERPSTRLSTMANEQKAAVAKERGEELGTLSRLLKGDLDWIVMKCLEKDRTRRYETANGLATDIGRHLQNEPVIARPPSTAYKLQKAFRRNKLVFGAATAVAVALVVGLSLAAIGWRQTRFQRDKALKAQRETEVARPWRAAAAVGSAISAKSCRRGGAEGLGERAARAAPALRGGHEPCPAIAQAEQSWPGASAAGPTPAIAWRGGSPRMGMEVSLATDPQRRPRHAHEPADDARIRRKLFTGWHSPGRGLARRTRRLVGCPEPTTHSRPHGPRESPVRTRGFFSGSQSPGSHFRTQSAHPVRPRLRTGYHPLARARPRQVGRS